MLTPVLKFTEIKKDPNTLLGLDHAYICKRGDVVAHVVSNERMLELSNTEKEINFFSKSLEDMLNEMHSNGRISYEVYTELFGLL